MNFDIRLGRNSREAVAYPAGGGVVSFAEADSENKNFFHDALGITNNPHLALRAGVAHRVLLSLRERIEVRTAAGASLMDIYLQQS